MAFAPLEEIEPPIVLTIRGNEYTLPVLMLDQIRALNERLTGGATPADLAKLLLGDELLGKLAADGASLGFVERVILVALAEAKFGRDYAEAVWADPSRILAFVNAAKVAAEAAAGATSGAHEVPTADVSPDQGPVS
ncbi:DUF7426 family protein [Sinomonas sp. P10A9]|uniref:DUF7426 domain-containing protein n=1 Tax=Sinomonas puerhi TaxID=3238584 RepID=A0AB39L1F4_9MICC